MCLGLAQISVIVEITVRVRESINTLAVITKKKKFNAQSMINDVIANQKKSDRYVLILHISVIISSIALISMIIGVSAAHEHVPADADEQT